MASSAWDKWLQALTARLLRVRRSELDRTLRMGSLALVVGWAMYTAFNATQALFLSRAHAEAYPFFFIVLALTVWPAVALQGALTRRVGIGRALRYNLLADAGLGVAIYAAYGLAETPVVAFAAYVLYSVAFELAMLLFWAFASQHFNLLEGKRIFPVIAAGSSVGYILAGLTSSTVAAVWNTESLVLIWSAGAALAGLLAYRMERRLFRPPVVEEADEFLIEAQAGGGGPLRSLSQAAGHLRTSRLVLALVLLGALLVVAMRVSDYFVALVFVRATRGDVRQLTQLIGYAWLVSYLVQLGLSLVLTRWLLGRAGVRNAILLLPLATLAGFVAVAAAPVLASSLFLFIVRNGLQTGVDDPAQNVLATALPEQVAPRLKVLMDNLVLPGAAVLAGLLLLALQAVAGRSTVELLALLGIPVAFLFLAAAAWVRQLYVGAIYERLRAHALSLSDFSRALGRPTAAQVLELRGYVADEDPRIRRFATAAMGRLAPEAFGEMVPELAVSGDAFLRRLAFQLAPPGAIGAELLEPAAQDADPWVVAAAAVAGFELSPPWPPATRLLAALAASPDPEARAAAVWAAASVVDEKLVVDALADAQPRVRLEAIRSFAKMKGSVAGSAVPLVRCLTDHDPEVRRAALQEAIRWAPPAGRVDAFADALIDSLAVPDRAARRLAAQAIAVQCPQALDRVLPMLEAGTETAAAAVEALLRSGRADLLPAVQRRLQLLFADAQAMAALAARLRALRRVAGGEEDARFAFLGIALEDYHARGVELGLAAMRALHGKRGFAAVEAGLRSDDAEARVEATETLLNFGPPWLANPLGQLLDADAFDAITPRPLTQAELQLLGSGPDRWINLAASSVQRGIGGPVKELIALKKVPLFAQLTLDQLASIDRLMVTRAYARGERIFAQGDLGSELYVVLEGEVLIKAGGPGKQVELARIGPGGAFGEMALFEDMPRSATAEAAGDCTVRVLRKDRFNAIVHEHPEVLLEVIKYLSQRLRSANEQLQVAGRQAPATGSRPLATGAV